MVRSITLGLFVISLHMCCGHLDLGFLIGTPKGTGKTKTTQTQQVGITPKNFVTSASLTLTQSSKAEVVRSTMSTSTNLAGGSTTESEIGEKHELEEEYPQPPEIADDCVNNSTGSGSGQEIDESKDCVITTTTKKPDSGLEIDETKKNAALSLGSKLPSILNLPLPKLPVPSLPSLEKDTITFTHTRIRPYTIYKQIHPSCLKLEKVSSLCDGNLITIQPTPITKNDDTKMKFDLFSSVENTNNEAGEQLNHSEDDYINPTATFSMPVVSSTYPATQNGNVRDNILDVSELDYEFEEIAPRGKAELSTPHLEYTKEAEEDHSEANVLPYFLTGGPEIEFVTEYIPSTTVKSYVDDGVTATVIARNCLPRDIHMPFCDSLNVLSAIYSFNRP